MNIDLKLKDNTCKVTISDRLVLCDQANFRDMMSKLAGLNFISLTVDLTAASFVDSAGIGMLLMLQNASQAKNITPSYLLSENGQISDAFRLANLDSVFDIKMSA